MAACTAFFARHTVGIWAGIEYGIGTTAQGLEKASYRPARRARHRRRRRTPCRVDIRLPQRKRIEKLEKLAHLLSGRSGKRNRYLVGFRLSVVLGVAWRRQRPLHRIRGAVGERQRVFDLPLWARSAHSARLFLPVGRSDEVGHDLAGGGSVAWCPFFFCSGLVRRLFPANAGPVATVRSFGLDAVPFEPRLLTMANRAYG